MPCRSDGSTTRIGLGEEDEFLTEGRLRSWSRVARVLIIAGVRRRCPALVLRDNHRDAVDRHLALLGGAAVHVTQPRRPSAAPPGSSPTARPPLGRASRRAACRPASNAARRPTRRSAAARRSRRPSCRARLLRREGLVQPRLPRRGS